jgi:hypothetical protein
MSLVLNVEILGEFKKLTQATTGAGKDLKGLNSSVSKISKGMKAALGAIGVGFSLGVVIKELKEATKAAIEDTKSQELLANQLRNTVNASDAQIKSVEKSIGKMQIQAAVADDELRPAFAQLTRATGDTAQSTKLLDLALDISAGSGKSLEAVTMALTKAYNGQFGALTKLGVPMTDQILNASQATTAQKELNKALTAQQQALELYGVNSPEYEKATQKLADAQDKLNRITAEGTDWQGQLATAFAGSAAAAANTDPFQRMNILFGELQEQVGLALLPYLQDFSEWLAEPGSTEFIQSVVDVIVDLIKNMGIIVGWVVKYKEAIIPLTVSVGLLTAGFKAYAAIMTLVAARNAAVAASNAALAASNTAVATSAGAATAAMKLLAGAAAVGAVLTIPGSAAQPGTVPSTMPKPAPIAPMPVFPGNAPQTGLPGANNKPPVIVNQNITVNSASTNATGIVSSLQGYQNQTGVTISKLLK